MNTPTRLTLLTWPTSAVFKSSRVTVNQLRKSDRQTYLWLFGLAKCAFQSGPPYSAENTFIYQISIFWSLTCGVYDYLAIKHNIKNIYSLFLSKEKQNLTNLDQIQMNYTRFLLHFFGSKYFFVKFWLRRLSGSGGDRRREETRRSKCNQRDIFLVIN